MQTKHIINILVVVIVAMAFLTLSTTSSSEGWYPSPDPCVPMTESCYKKIWSNAGCTTDPTKLPGQLHWALKQRGSDLEIDANKWKQVRKYLASSDKKNFRFSLQKKLVSFLHKNLPNLDLKTL